MRTKGVLFVLVLAAGGASIAVPAAPTDEQLCASASSGRKEVMRACDRAVATATGAARQAAAHYNRGIGRHSAGDLEGAIDDFTRAIALAGDFPAAFLARGRAWQAGKEADRARADYDQAIRLDPRHPAAYHNRGLLLGGGGRHREAIADYSVAVRLDPRSAESYIGRGLAFQALGEHGMAVEDFNAAVSLAPRESKAYTNRGVSWRALGKLEFAIADFTEAIRLGPASASALSNRGVCRRLLGEPERALEDFDRALALDPAHVMARYNRAVTRFWQRSHALAEADLAEVVAIDRTHLHAAIWRFFAQRHLRDPRAQSLLAATLDRSGSKQWPAPIARHLLGEAGMVHSSAGERECEANFYAGYALFLDGHLPEARSRLRAATDRCPGDFLEAEAASAALAELDGIVAPHAVSNSPGSKAPRADGP